MNDILENTFCAECNNSFTYKYSSSNWKYCSIDCTNKNKYHPNSNKVHRKVYNGIQLDSGGEYNFILLIEKYNIKWIKNKHISFPFTKSDGKNLITGLIFIYLIIIFGLKLRENDILDPMTNYVEKLLVIILN